MKEPDLVLEKLVPKEVFAKGSELVLGKSVAKEVFAEEPGR